MYYSTAGMEVGLHYCIQRFDPHSYPLFLIRISFDIYILHSLYLYRRQYSAEFMLWLS